jgi:hypothetical protein
VRAASDTRTARFAAWVTARLAGRISSPAAVDGIVGGDAFHDVVGLPGQPEPLPLPDGLRVIADLGTTAVRYAPAAPGRVAELPGPSTFNQQAVRAGGAAVALAGPALAWLPEVTWHGRDGDAVASVRWHTHPVAPRVWAPTDLASAARLLVSSFTEALDELDRLDVARERPGVRALLQERAVLPPSRELPPGLPAAAGDLLDRAVQLRHVVALAAEDDGGSVTGGEQQRRAAALRALDTDLVVAEAAAWNAGLPAVAVSQPR